MATVGRSWCGDDSCQFVGLTSWLFYAWCHAAFILLYILIYKLRKSIGNKQTAIHIETQQWYAIIELLKEQGWKVTREYIGFDKGIDYDQYVLKLNGEKILFSWDNLDEGKIQCSKKSMKKIDHVWETQVKEEMETLKN